jgi:phosphoglycolate phosphatase
MNGKLPRYILFDLDGTLIDSLPGIEYSIREAFSKCKLPLATQSVQELIGPPIRTILSRAGNIVATDCLDQLVVAFRASYDSEGWQKTASFPRANELLRILHREGHQLFVVSNKPRRISLQILERQGMLDYFESIVTADSRSPAYSDKKEMIDSLLAERSINAADCLMVGDTEEDAGAAASAGVQFVWMAHGYGNLGSGHSRSVRKLDSFAEFLKVRTEESVSD